MITGKSSARGTFSYHRMSSGLMDVTVTRMPEDDYSIRITISHSGEKSWAVKSNMIEAELLWAALDEMAKDLKWSKDLK